MSDSSPVLPLPDDTSHAWRREDGERRNLGLLLDRFALHDLSTWELLMREREGRRTRDRTGEGAKAVWLRNQPTGNEEDAPLRPSTRLDPTLVTRHLLRWEAMLGACGVTEALKIRASPEWRFVVGLGAESVLETSIRLHRLYGFPIIPGSALKGLTRSYALLLADEVQGETIEERERDLLFQQVFGTKEESGGVIFLDAVPMRAPKLKLDVMNPHYPAYYRGENVPPADYLSPSPVYFLTVEKESPFLFAVGPRRRGNAEDEVAAAQARQWLWRALQELGVGAKTTAGYGCWREWEDVQRQVRMRAER